jgi:hypothetical protein
MPLVEASDFEGLPQEPEARWLYLRDLVEKRLDNGFDMNNGGHETYDLLEYVQVLSAAAEELGISGLKEISPSNVREDFDTFRAHVAAMATRLSLRLTIQNSTHSVALSHPTRKKILSEIENLRLTIGNSELSDSQKTKASKNIDQLHMLIVAPRTDILRVGIILVGIGAVSAETTSFLADLPSAIGTITALIGADKQEEESDQALIADSRKKLQIQDLRETPDEKTHNGTDYGSNDEIPF